MTSPGDLAGSRRAFVIAPAGCGKTELIARAIANDYGKTQLVLTHTHAGVSAIRSRLKKYGVPPRGAAVDTIAGFALRLSTGYPSTSGLAEFQPTGAMWNQVNLTALKVLERSFARRMLAASYGGLYVDEYQDCTVQQHRIVQALAEIMPTRVLGDPLQGIFDFAGTLVSWDDDIPQYFEELEPLSTPFRWKGRNEDLGDWLLSIRDPLLQNRTLDISGAPIEIGDASQPKQVLKCMEFAGRTGSVVAIRKWAADAHNTARNLGGRYSSMEEMECGDLVKMAKRLDQSEGTRRAALLIEFASLCATSVSTVLSTVRKQLDSGHTPARARRIELNSAIDALVAVCTADQSDWNTSLIALERLSRLPGVRIFRGELLAEMRKILTGVADGSFENLTDAAWRVRDRARHQVRKLDYRLVSRALLVKGMEFDHCLVLDASEWNARELYVALTRGSRSLAVHVPGAKTDLIYRGAKP